MHYFSNKKQRRLWRLSEKTTILAPINWSIIILIGIGAFMNLHPEQANQTEEEATISALLSNVQERYKNWPSYPLGNLNFDFLSSEDRFISYQGTDFSEVQPFRVQGNLYFFHPEIGVFDYYGQEGSIGLYVRDCDRYSPNCKKSTIYSAQNTSWW